MSTTPVLIRTSERATYRRCRQKWVWHYVDRLESGSDKPALVFGSMVHAALEQWYKPGKRRGTHPAKAFKAIIDEYPRHVISQWDEDEERIESVDLGIAMLEGYVEHYGKEPHLEVIQPEMAGQVDVLDRQGRYVCTYVFKSDLVVRDHSGRRPVLRMLEHKTAKSIELIRINSGYGEQGVSYWWALHHWLRHKGILEPDDIIGSIVYNVLRKGLPDDRPTDEEGYALNKDGTRSKRQPRPLYDRQTMSLGHNELEEFNRRIRGEAWEMRQVRNGKAPIYKNPTRDCSWDCEFVDMCELHEMGSDWETVAEMEFHEWDPYSDHELAKEKL